MVRGCCFDGDKGSVALFLKPFFNRVAFYLNDPKRQHSMDYIVGKAEELIPFPDPLHLLKRIRSQILSNSMVIDHSDAPINTMNIIDARNILTILDLKCKRVFDKSQALKLDDTLALALLNPSNVE